MAGDSSRGVVRKPTKVVAVPKELRASLPKKDIDSVVHTWNTTFGIEVVPRFHQHPNRDLRQVYELGIFGNSINMDSAIRAINKWIETANRKPRGASGWLKTEAFDENKWYYGQIEAMETERKEKFKGPVPDDCSPPYKVIIEWPKELLDSDPPVTPRDTLGSKMETLDSIRFEDEVFIALLPPPNPRWKVEIQGFEVENVEAAEEKYNNLIQKALSKMKFGSTAFNVILDEEEGENIMLEQAPYWWPSKVDKIVPRLKALPMSDPGSFRRKPFDPTTLGQIQQALGNSFETIRFTRSSFNLAIRFGSLTLRGLSHDEIGKAYPTRSFKNSIDGNVGCHSHKWLFDHKPGERLLGRLQSATHLLEPIRSSSSFFSSAPKTLEGTHPTYRGVWVLQDPNKRTVRPQNATGHTSGQFDGGGLLVVQIDWTPDEEGSYEKTPTRYFRLNPGMRAPTDHLDVNLIELAESRVWHFGLESMEREPRARVSPVIVKFADQVALEPGPSQSYPKLFARWNLSQSIKISFGRLEKIYTYGIKDTGYMVDCVALWYPHLNVPCWGLSVRHREWEMHLNQLERLPPGSGADWENPTAIFFPNNGLSESKRKVSRGKERASDDGSYSAGEGVRLLVGKLMDLSQVINLDEDPQEPSLGRGLHIRDFDLISLGE